MSNSKKDKGFSTPEIILVVLLVCVIAAVGWYVYHQDHKKNNKSVSTTSSSTNHRSNGDGDSISDVVAYGKQQNAGIMQIPNGTVTANSVAYADYLDNIAFDNNTAIADISLKNTSSQTQTFNLDDFSLQLPGGEIVASTGAYTQTSQSGSDDLSVGAGGTVEEDLAFTPIQGTEKSGSGYLEYKPTSSAAGGSGSSTNGSETGSATGSQTTASPAVSAATVKVAVTFKVPNPTFQQ